VLVSITSESDQGGLNNGQLETQEVGGAEGNDHFAAGDGRG